MSITEVRVCFAKIMAEIQTKIKEENYGVISDHTHEDGLEESLEIINKYRKELFHE